MGPQKIPSKLGLLLLLVSPASPLIAQTWTPTSAPSANWRAVASSADGSKLVAAVGGGLIYTSTNGGTSWMAGSVANTNWISVASSAEGTRLVAAAGSKRWDPAGVVAGLLYTSTNSGATWTPVLMPAEPWVSVACSADGASLVAAGNPPEVNCGSTISSTNFGDTWSAFCAGDWPPTRWGTVACSASGARMVLGAYSIFYYEEGAIYASTNAGATWSWASVAVGAWYAMAASADGRKLVAASCGVSTIPQAICVSTDSGATWTVTALRACADSSVASSADGTRLLAASGGLLYTSTNSGATWTVANAPATNWTAVASSADGCKLVATAGGPSPGMIYTCQTTPTPLLGIARSGGNVLLSWTVPSSNLVLQQNSDLATTNWTEVPITPTLNYTNLHYEVSLPGSGGPMFYRLAAN